MTGERTKRVGYEADSLEGRFLAGEVGAYAVVSRWVAQVLTLPRFRILRSEWPDVHQEVLRRIVDSLRHGRFREGLDLRVYVQGIARYAAREVVIRILRESGSSLPDDVAVPSRAEDLALDRQKVRLILEQMPEPCREIFRLLFYQQLRYEEIGDRLGVPLGTVKSRAHRCLERGRNLLLGRTQESWMEGDDHAGGGGSEKR